MATFDFPNAPAVDQTHEQNGLEWVWTGSVWNVVPPDYRTEIEIALDRKVSVSGDTMSGALLLRQGAGEGDPGQNPGYGDPHEATSKAYQERHFVQEAPYTDDPNMGFVRRAAGPPDDFNYGAAAGTWVPSAMFIDAPRSTYVYGRYNGDWIPVVEEAPTPTGEQPDEQLIYARGGRSWVPTVSKEYVDDKIFELEHEGRNHVQKTGDSMTGGLFLPDNEVDPGAPFGVKEYPSNALHATHKYYVDSYFPAEAPPSPTTAPVLYARRGGEPYLIGGRPYAPNGAWVEIAPITDADRGLTITDGRISLDVATGIDLGGVFVPAGQGLELTLSGGLSLAPANQVTMGGMVDAPYDGEMYARQNANWTRTDLFIDAPEDGKLYGRQYEGLGTPGDPFSLRWMEAISPNTVEILLNNKVDRSGDTMQGPLFLPRSEIDPNDPGGPTLNYPNDPYHATHKFYVDQLVASGQLYQGTWAVATNSPDLNAVDPLLNGFMWIAQTVDPDVTEIAPVDIPGLIGLQINAGDHIIWNEGLQIYERIFGSSMSVYEAELRYVSKIGDSMQGFLTLHDDPVQPFHAATRNWVELEIQLLVPEPANDDRAYARKWKEWVPTEVFVDAPADELVYGRKDNEWVVVPEEAPDDGKIYGRQHGGLGTPGDPIRMVWTETVTRTDLTLLDNNKVSKSGDSMQGPLFLPRSEIDPNDPGGPTLDYPNDPYHAAHKFYVDKVAGSATIYVSDTPPLDPVDSSMWFESDSGNFFVYYNDGNSTQWVQMNGATGVEEAPQDGKIYGRQYGGMGTPADPKGMYWKETIEVVDLELGLNNKVDKSGDSMQGGLYLPRSEINPNDPGGPTLDYPNDPQHAVTKAYVDAIPNSQVIVSDLPPTTADENQLWWDSDNGVMYLWYDDGNSTQWIQVGGTGGGAAGTLEDVAIDDVLYARTNKRWTPISPADYGDVKTSFRAADHFGWIKLDGRSVATLTPAQQGQAARIGFTTTLPDATSAVALQNGLAMGAVSGSMTRAISVGNLPAVNVGNSAVLTSGGYDPGAVTSSSAGAHQHNVLYRRASGSDTQTYPGLASDNSHNSDQLTDSAGAHTHTIDMPNHTHTIPAHAHALGGSGTPFDYTPKSFSVNYFVFLGR